jgi:hypothetical protein
MLRNIKRLYEQYKEYVRVDLILYGMLIAIIIIYSFLNMIIVVQYWSQSL